jgi:thiol-disulfide isomerase/thioredoxin
VRVVRYSILIGLVASASGCLAPSNKGQTAPPNNISPSGDRPFWKASDDRRAPTASIPNGNGLRPASGNEPDYNGVLAGQVYDPVLNRKPTKAYILVAPADNSKPPVDFPVDENGLFLISGLVTGRSYLLTARTDEWGKLYVGRTQVAPPYPKLVIRLREDLATSDVPPPPPQFGSPYSGPKAAIPGRGPPSPPLPDLLTPTGLRTDADAGWTPGSAGSVAPTVPLGPPPGDAGPNSDRENIAGGNRPINPAVRPAPIISMPGPPLGPGSLPDPDPPPTGSGRSGSSMQPRPMATTAFCEINGNRVVNFGLPESDGRFWEFHQRRGKLLLVDFWASWCGPCKQIIPTLKAWERKYSFDGLEVIGVACDGLSTAEVRAVNNAAQQHGINYRVLLADHNDRDPVQQKFRVDGYPTLILIDENGTIIWRGNSANLSQLEGIIQQRLHR